MTPLRQIGRHKNLPGIGFTVGEFRGVVQLARIKGRYVPASTAALRANHKRRATRSFQLPPQTKRKA
jgi:hypothetical protein